jgi:hypothetical protein
MHYFNLTVSRHDWKQRPSFSTERGNNARYVFINLPFVSLVLCL